MYGGEWLTVDVPTLQLLAYISLTAVNLVVAGSALFLSYRQSLGWKPIAFILSTGMISGPDDPGVYRGTIQIEVWNRRKYPIVIRGAEITVSSLKLLEPLTHRGKRPPWSRLGRSLLHRSDVVLEPNSKHNIDVEYRFPKRTLDDLDEVISWRVWYFDPRRNRYSQFRSRLRFAPNQDVRPGAIKRKVKRRIGQWWSWISRWPRRG